MQTAWGEGATIRREALLVVDSSGHIRHLGDEMADWVGPGAMPGIGDPAWGGSSASVITQRRLVLNRVLASKQSLSFIERIGDRWASVTAHGLELADSPAVAFVYRDINREVNADEELKRLRLRILTVQEEERRAISQQLHDELGQGMTVLLMQVRGVVDLAQTDDVRSRALEAAGQVEALTKRMRQIFYRIRPPSFEDSSLVDAIADYCASTAHSTGLTIDVDAEPDLPRIEGMRATALYRLLQEAVTNAVKHSGCTHLWVSLSRERDGVCLSVEDDGYGFNMTDVKYGMGLTGLTERFALLEGDLQVDARPRGGTRLTGYLAVSNGEEAALR